MKQRYLPMLFVAMGLLIWPSSGWALGANDLYKKMCGAESNTQLDSGMCFDEARKVAPTRVTQRSGEYCIPKGTTKVQVRQAVRSYLAKKPRDQIFPAAWVVTLALAKTFPCPGR
jgi:hypothetical protein